MWQSGKWIENAREVFGPALDRPTAKIALWFFAFVAAWGTFGAQFLPKECADKLPTVYGVAIMTGDLLDWYWWVIILLIIALVAALEYGIRVSGIRERSRRHAISTQAEFPAMTGTATVGVRRAPVWLRIRRFLRSRIGNWGSPIDNTVLQTAKTLFVILFILVGYSVFLSATSLLAVRFAPAVGVPILSLLYLLLGAAMVVQPFMLLVSKPRDCTWRTAVLFVLAVATIAMPVVMRGMIEQG